MKIKIIAECELCGSQKAYNTDTTNMRENLFLPYCADKGSTLMFDKNKPYCSNEKE